MKLFATGRDLQEKVVHAGFWSIALLGTTRMFGFLRTLIIARLLAPEDIGLFALASLTLLTVSTLTRPGFNSALIYFEGDIQKGLNVAWSVNALLGIFRAGLLLVIAPHVASFFNAPQIASFIRLLAVVSIFRGFSNIGILYFQKDLEYHKTFFLELSRILPDLVVSITAALILQNAWALTFGLVAGNCIHSIFTYRFHSFRPRFRFNADVFRKLMRYGVWVTLGGIMVFISTQGASLVVGKVIGVYALGLYQLAQWITEAALVEVSSSFGGVAFPAYSQIQRDPQRFQTAFVKMAGFSFSYAIPVTVAIIMTGDFFVDIFFGKQWAGMILTLKISAAAAVFHTIANTGWPAFQGLGYPRWSFQIQLVGALALMIAIYPMARTWGIEGAAGTLLLRGLAMAVFWFMRIRGLLGLTRHHFVQMFGPALIAAGAMTVAFFLYFFLAPPWTSGAGGFSGILWFSGLAAATAGAGLVALRAVQSRFPDNQPLQVVAIFLRG